MKSSVVYHKHALVPQKRTVEEFCGKSVAELDPQWERAYIALLDGKALMRADWSRTVLFEGRVLMFVDVNAIPQGGGGSSNPAKVILSIAAIAFAVTAPYAVWGLGLAMGSIGGALASGAIMMVGSMVINAIAPTASASISNAQTPAASPTYSLQAQGNTARIEAAIPEQFGRHMAYPDFAATPYQEFSGNDQYLYSLLCVGRGQYDIESMFIEDTPIDNFEDVNVEVVNPGEVVNLFPTNVTTSVEVSGQDLEYGVYSGPFVANASGTLANSLGVDFVAAKGLFYVNDDGSLAGKSVKVLIEARLIDDDGVAIGAWFSLVPKTIVPVINLPFSPRRIHTPWSDMVDPAKRYTYEKTYYAATTTPQRYSAKFIVPQGRYEVRVQRTNTKDTSTRAGHDFAWGSLRAYLVGPQTYGDVTLLAVRMKATSQLSGTSYRKIKVVATRKLPIWNGSSWSAPTATTSIAWAIAYACKSAGLPDSRVDLAGLLSLDAVWSARGDECNGRVDNFLSFWDAVTKIASAGRAKPYMQAGIIRLFRDQAASLPVAMFSMRNIIKGSFSVDYLMPTSDTADALNVGYFDETTWTQKRVPAKLPGSTASKPAKIELSFVTNRQQAFREGMYNAACNRYRRKVIKLTTEMEGFIPSFGDLAVIQHDMAAWGQSGVVTAWAAGTNTLTADAALDWESGKPHYVGLKRKDGSMFGPVAATKGSGNDIILASAPDFTPYTGLEYERTNFVFGWGDTWGQKVRILSTKPKGLYAVEIEAVNEDNNVHTAEDGVIAPSPLVSQLPGITSAPDVDGLIATAMPGDKTRVLLAWLPSPWADHYVVEVSSLGSTAWTRVGETRVSNYTVKVLYGPSTVWRVAAVGLKRGDWKQVLYSDIVVSAWDPDISGFKAAANKTAVDLLWNTVADWNVASYEIRVGASWAAGTVIVTGHKSSSFSWRPNLSCSLAFWLKAIDGNGVYSVDAASTILAVTPPSVSGLTQKVIDNNVLLSWTNVQGSFEITTVEVRKGLDFATSTLVGETSGTFSVVFETASGTYKYWVVPVDSAGLKGAGVGVYAIVSQPPDYILHDQRALTFAGTKTNAVVELGDLIAPVNATETFQDHFTAHSWTTPQAQVTAGSPLFIQPAMETGQYSETIDYGALIPSTKISLSLAKTEVAGLVTIAPTIYTSTDGVTWGAGTAAYELYASSFRYIKVVLAFSTANNGIVEITDSLLKLDVKQKSIQGSKAVVSTDSGGTNVDITGKFIDVQSINLTPQGTTACYAIYDFVDVANPTSFKILLFNSSGVRINGTVSYTVKGV